jgi:hypothetical protein
MKNLQYRIFDDDHQYKTYYEESLNKIFNDHQHKTYDDESSI